MTRWMATAVLFLTVGSVALLAAQAWAAGEVDPADINPLADTVGWILAVPIARIFGAALVILAVAAFGHGAPGVGMLLTLLAGMVFVGPQVVKTVILHAAELGVTGGP